MRKILAAFSLLVASALALAIPFSPRSAATATQSCTGSSARTAVASTITGQTQLELQNVGTVTIFVESGDSTVTAAVATGYPVPAGQSKLITVTTGVTNVACITAGTTATLYVTVGLGES